MVSTKQDIIEWVLAAKEDPDAADSLINQYMGFIRAEAGKLSFGDKEDEMSARAGVSSASPRRSYAHGSSTTTAARAATADTAR